MYSVFKEELFWDHVAGQWRVMPYRFVNNEIENGLTEVVQFNEKEMIVIYHDRSNRRFTAIVKAIDSEGIREYQSRDHTCIERGISSTKDENLYFFLDGSVAYFSSSFGDNFSQIIRMHPVFSGLNFPDCRVHLKKSGFLYETRIIRLSDKKFIINAALEIHLLDISSDSGHDQILDFGSREYNPDVGVLTPTSFVVSTKDNNTLMIFSEDRNDTWQVRELGVAGISAQRIEVIDKESFYIFDGHGRVEYWEIPIEERRAFHERRAAQTASPSLPSDI